MMRFYSDPSRESETWSLTDCEVWQGDCGGYFYAFGFIGCLHDSDPFGPFDTEAEAIENARDIG